ncbi:uncharacterized protein LOC129619384 [Condylostylus longicornis]|uniref:uncharacterized protein LOC129619384 n=1 Tax=Condylostylus longicornis TaxID=2530218 RepID=UPI00244E4C47|nr:uncharacterized protein LOC129619384 [Condylostylus longicornis]
MGCDANAHHVAWGSSDNNTRGESLLEFVVKENLEIFNVGNAPTFVTRVREAVLDITFGSPNVGFLVRDWKVSGEVSMSDHKIIRFCLGGLMEKKSSFRNPRRTNWEGYRRDLKAKLSGASVRTVARHPLVLERAVEERGGIMVEAFESNCPISVPRDFTDTPWWATRLENLRVGVSRLFNKAKREGTWEEYKMNLTARKSAGPSAEALDHSAGALRRRRRLRGCTEPWLETGCQ